MARSALHKYLRGHAETEARVAEQLGHYTHAIAVPACAEHHRFLTDLEPALDEQVITIVVVNGAVGDEDHAATNRETLDALCCDGVQLAEGMFLRQDPPLLIVDRASPGREVPAKQAVGLARKISADIACALFAAGKVSDRFIRMTDCDVRLPADYVRATSDDAVLLTYPFRHVPGGDASIDEAHAIYEIFLRYYVLGLRAAGSRYALHTIGSSLAVDALAYASVRGMPRRQAAEDFYLVNKVAKLGKTVTPTCTPLSIVSRRSLRVPFGTGRSTAKIAEAGQRLMYHPRIFELVGHWLQAVDAMADDGRDPVEEALARAAGDADALANALEMLDARASLSRALSAAPPDAAARRARAHEHFDAFRTRKLVHLLRDGGLGELDWRQALDEAPFIDVDPQADTATLCEALAGAEVSCPRQGR